jgi:general secretion pathway protein D
MKTILLASFLALSGFGARAQSAPGTPDVPPPGRVPRFGNNGPVTPPRYPQADAAKQAEAQAEPPKSKEPEEMIPAGTINFQGVDVDQVLDVYAKLVGRTLLRSTLPNAKIVLKTETPLTKTEAIEALQAVLALNGISVVNIGDKFVKVGPVDQANTFGAQFSNTSVTNLPDLGSYITRIVQLKYVKPSEMVPIIQPFAKLANSILPIDSNGILVLRDNAENVKRMMEMIQKIDVSTPSEFISEVIPIRYAEAADIANALNSLGSGGGSTVTFGSSGGRSSINGLRGGMTGSSGFNQGGYRSTSGFGGQTGMMPQSDSITPMAIGSNGAPTGGTTFQQRLQSIINRASGPKSGGGSGEDQIQVFGQTKIIADERSNSLLIFATRQDMENIKHVVSQLDVLLAQVLIESIIMDVNLGDSVNTGVSVVQQPKQYNNSNVTGGGAMLNGPQSFLGTLQSLATNGLAGSSLPTNALSSGLSYFGNIGDTWNIAVQAAASDNNANIIQRPRIQTSQAKPAQFFVGETVPYVTSTYNNAYNGGYGGSSYSQLSVGVELDVTPFINPEGLVVMDIQQEIDEISGYTTIDGNQVPNTVKRTLSSEIAVNNRDTVILGGFVKSDKSQSRSGVPLLMDIPLLGRLFSSHSDSKGRSELIVLMRPTVLKTPEIAAAQTIKEAQRLPGVSAAAAADAAYERELIDAERKKELKNAKAGKPADGFFNMKTSGGTDDANFGAAEESSAGRSPGTNRVSSQATPENQEKARAALEQEMNNPSTP